MTELKELRKQAAKTASRLQNLDQDTLEYKNLLSKQRAIFSEWKETCCSEIISDLIVLNKTNDVTIEFFDIWRSLNWTLNQMEEDYYRFFRYLENNPTDIEHLKHKFPRRYWSEL